MDLSNFNQELASQFVGAYASKSEVAARQLFQALKADAGLPVHNICTAGVCDCAENCECINLSYNNVVEVAKVLGDLLDQIRVAGVDQAYGQLIPRFFCIAEKALTFEQGPNNGNADSESSSEQDSEEGTGW